jgi:putative phosphoribosyl transferase
VRYRDRAEAGRRLARAVARQVPSAGTVVALSAASLAVAQPVAEAVGAVTSVLAAEPVEVGDAMHPPAYVGAVGSRGSLVLHPELLRRLEVGSDALEAAVGRAERRLDPAAPAWPPARLLGPVVLVDDGTASITLLRAAIDLIGPASSAPVVIASPCLSQDAMEELLSLGCEVVADQVLPWVAWFELHEQFYEDDQGP